jgi:hypothetical protein
VPRTRQVVVARVQELAGVHGVEGVAGQHHEVEVPRLHVAGEKAVDVVLDGLDPAEGEPLLRELEVVAHRVIAAELAGPQPARRRARGQDEDHQGREGRPGEQVANGSDPLTADLLEGEATPDERHGPGPHAGQESRGTERGIEDQEQRHTEAELEDPVAGLRHE